MIPIKDKYNNYSVSIILDYSKPYNCVQTKIIILIQ